MYSILFFQAYSVDPIKGGVARVCYNLALGFMERGMKVYSLAPDNSHSSAYLDHFCLPDGRMDTENNFKYIESLFNTLHFDFVINSNPNEGWTSNLLSIVKGKAIIISHYHNSPVALNSYVSFLNFYPLNKWRCVKNLSFQIRKRKNLKDNIQMMRVCDKMVLLSNAFKEELNKLVEFPDNKITAISNPLFVSRENSDYSEDIKREKVLLFVGRVAETQKRIHSLLNIWRLLYRQLPEWRLEIVGGGEELDYWRSRAKKMNLERCFFEGFQSPENYYKKAQILLMTSNYEGFGMVLIEAMYWGCIPFAFDSYASLRDIITDNDTGRIIRPFDEGEYANCILSLIGDEKNLERIRKNCIIKSKEFDINNIVDKWVFLFKELKDKN